jgi:hypothetical protein
MSLGFGTQVQMSDIHAASLYICHWNTSADEWHPCSLTLHLPFKHKCRWVTSMQPHFTSAIGTQVQMNDIHAASLYICHWNTSADERHPCRLTSHLLLEHKCRWTTSMQPHFTSAILLLHFIMYSLTRLYDTYMNQTSSLNPLVLNVTNWQHAKWRSEHQMLPVAALI